MKCVYLVKYKQLTASKRHSRWNRPNQSDSLQKWAQLDTVLNWGLESPPNPQAGRRRAGAALWRAAKAERPALRSADIPVRGFGRLSSRPALPAQTFRPGTVSRACCPNHFGDNGARLPARDTDFVACSRKRSLSESQPQHVRQPQNPWNFVRSFGNPGGCRWDTRAPFHLGNTLSRCTLQKSPL